MNEAARLFGTSEEGKAGGFQHLCIAVYLIAQIAQFRVGMRVRENLQRLFIPMLFKQGDKLRKVLPESPRIPRVRRRQRNAPHSSSPLPSRWISVLDIPRSVRIDMFRPAATSLN